MKKVVKKQEIEADFLENVNLYQKRESNLPNNPSDLKGENINLFCKICNSNQTFIFSEPFFEGKNLYKIARYKGLIGGTTLAGSGGMSYTPPRENIKGFLCLVYKCAKCQQERAIFLIGISDEKIMKIGQYPSIDISLPDEIKILKDDTIEELYKKGKTSENFGYGIGSFAYYRRIVELKIDELLEKIKEFFPEDKKKVYDKCLKDVRKEKNTEKKIDIVKDIVTDEIISNNLLKNIYTLLSVGIHSLSDEECLNSAQSLREFLLLLIKQIEDKKEDKRRLISAQKNIEKIIKKQGGKK